MSSIFSMKIPAEHKALWKLRLKLRKYQNLSEKEKAELRKKYNVAIEYNLKNLNKTEINVYNKIKYTIPINPMKIPEGEPNGWDVSDVKDMSFLFGDFPDFNAPIGNWNTSNVTTMKSMFMKSEKFNKVIAFSTQNVTDMSFMFACAWAFNQPVTMLDTSNLVKINSMFLNSHPSATTIYWQTVPKHWKFAQRIAHNLDNLEFSDDIYKQLNKGLGKLLNKNTTQLHIFIMNYIKLLDTEEINKVDQVRENIQKYMVETQGGSLDNVTNILSRLVAQERILQRFKKGVRYLVYNLESNKELNGEYVTLLNDTVNQEKRLRCKFKGGSKRLIKVENLKRRATPEQTKDKKNVYEFRF